MKIGYLCVGYNTLNGITKKTIAQLKEWKNHGHEIKVFAIAEYGYKDFSIFSEFDVEVIDIMPDRRHLWMLKYFMNFFSCKKILSYIISWKTDILYTRDDYFPWMEHIFKYVHIVREVNGDVREECRELLRGKNKNIFYYLFMRYCTFRSPFLADGSIFVTNELMSKLKIKRGLSTVISNGSNLSEFEMFPSPDNEKPTLVFIGSPGHIWHGVEKISVIAEAFPNFEFEIIGIEKENFPAKVFGNMHFHGYLERRHYLEIIKKADVGIGSLSMYRIDMNEACTLKLREYLACGIPVIIGYSDTDFPEAVPFILQIPNNEDNVKQNLEKISEFIYDIKGKRVPREAIGHLDFSFKEAQRLEFFQKILSLGNRKKVCRNNNP